MPPVSRGVASAPLVASTSDAVAVSNRRTVGLHEMVDGVQGSYEMLPRRAGGGWVQRGQARPLSMGEGIRSYVWRGKRKSPRWRCNAPILSDPSSGWIGYVQAPFGRRGCNGERAAGAPCQDERLAKPEPQAQDFVIQTHILRNVLTQKTGSKAALVMSKVAPRPYSETRHIERSSQFLSDFPPALMQMNAKAA